MWRSFLPLLFSASLSIVAASAQDALWSPPIGSGDWNTDANWTPAAVPTGIATFDLAATTAITFSAAATIDTLLFNPAAPAYSFSPLTPFSLTITGTGIVNNSANAPTFNLGPGFGFSLIFLGASTAANAIINDDGGATEFGGASTAGTATIININQGTVQLFGTATAGNASITNDNGGGTRFFETSSAGNSMITNLHGSVTLFMAASTAGNATILNNLSGSTQFYNTSTGANAKITNTGVGSTSFNDTSTAGSATLTDNGGETRFSNSSTAGTSNITNNAGGTADFCDATTGGNAVITNNAGGQTDFENTSTAGMATVTTNSGGSTLFINTSNGGQARFITNAGGSFDISGLTSGGISTGSIEGAGTYFLGSKSLTVGLNNLSTKVSGIITDGGLSGGTGGALVKVGTGTLILTGADTYSGGTTLDDGVLTVGSLQALGSGNLTVNAGTLNATVQSIQVKGNYTQNAGGTLQLQVAGANPGQYQSLNVGGNVSLGGTLQLISLGFQPKAGNRLTLITAGGTDSNQFANFVNPFASGPGFTRSDLIYGLNSVVLEFLSSPGPPGITTIDFPSFAHTPNQIAAANLLNAAQLDSRGSKLISFFDTEPFANYPGDFDRISPDGLTAFFEISFSNANIQRLNLEDRLDDIHNGSNGFNSNMKVNGGPVSPEGKEAVDGKSSKRVVEPVLQHAPENRWGVWVTGFGDFVNVDGDGNAQGYSFTTGGVSLGIDYRITEHLAIGAMGDYAHTWTSLNPGGHIDVDSGRGGLYATWYDHGFYLDGAIYGGHNNYDSSRAGLGGLATGGTEGEEWSTFICGGYDFHFASLVVGPLAALQYTSVHIDGFNESGSLAPMAIHAETAESLRSDVGFRAFYLWQIGKVLVEPAIRAAWEHEYKYSALPITASFVGMPESSATFFGPNEGHDSAVVSAGISAQWTPAIMTYLNYDGQFGRQNYDSNAVTGGVRFSF
jgi:outer membrane autotransporter protein